MNQSVNLLISGRVQGVFFRASAQKQATMLGVNGYARNLPDGRVEVVAEGECSAVEKLVAWCHQGPGGAIVDKVEITTLSSENQFGTFEIL